MGASHIHDMLELKASLLVDGVRAAEKALSGIGTERSGDDLHKCGLAGSVLSHQSVDLAGPEVKIDLGESLHPGIALTDLQGFEDIFRSQPSAPFRFAYRA